MLYTYLADKLVDVAIGCGAIKEEDRVLYQYAFEALVGHFCSFATMFLIAFWCKIAWDTLLYLILMYPLRIYSGGFHASTPGRCYVISTLMFIGVIACEAGVSKYLSMGILAVILLFISALVFILAPAESRNKPLDEDERKKYRVISRKLMLLEMAVILLLSAFGFPARGVYYALAAPATVALLLVLHDMDKRFHSITNGQDNRKTEQIK